MKGIRFFEIVAQVVKHGLFLSDQIFQAATGFLPIGGEAGLQGFQPIERCVQRLVEFLADMAPVALRVGMGLGRLCGIPAFGSNLLDISKDLAMPVQFPRHVRDDRAHKVEGFAKCCIGKGRAGGTGVRHQDIRDRRKGIGVQKSALRDQRSDLGFVGWASGGG
jgi:hypothetical protein